MVFALGVAEKFFSLFSRFALYDDEGCMLITLKYVHEGRALYDEVFSVYGPFSFYFKSFLLGLLGLRAGHDVGRLISFVLLVATVVAAAWLVARLTRSFVMTCLSTLVVLQVLNPVMNDPGHPHDLCGLLMIACPLLASFATTARRFTLVVAALGCIGGCLMLSKINIGILMAIALGSSLLMVSKRRDVARWFIVVSLPSLFLAVLVLLWPRIDKLWVQALAAVSLLSLALLLNVCYRVPHVAIASHWHYSVTVAMFLLSVSLILAWGVLCGTSLRGFVDGVILIGLKASKFYTVPMCYFLQPWIVPAYIIVALLSLKTITHHRTRFAISLSVFRLSCTLILVRIIYGNYFLFPQLAMPFSALLLVLPTDRTYDDSESFARTLLAFQAMMAVLIAYPVAGNQVGLASLPASVAVMVIAHDGISALRSQFRVWEGCRAQALASAGRLVVLAALVAFQFDATTRAYDRYQALTPLNLPGARLLRLEPLRVERYQKLTRTLCANADMFFTMPGLNSLYFWTQQEPPNGFNITGWMNLLNEPQQQSIIERLKASRSPCVVEIPDLMLFWDPRPAWTTTPLMLFIKNNFKPAASFDGYTLWISRNRSEVVEVDAAGGTRRSQRGKG